MRTVLDPIQNSLMHPAEEVLEEYVFHRLPESIAAQVEEHLLLCRACQDSVAEIDRFSSAMKAMGRPQPVMRRAARYFGVDIETILVPVFALALAVIAVPAVWRSSQVIPPPATVNLSSLRSSNGLATAPAGSRLIFSVAAPDLPGGSGYRLDLVNAKGDSIWKGSAVVHDGKLEAIASKPLAKGLYWVRLYGLHAEVLREFGLTAQ